MKTFTLYFRKDLEGDKPASPPFEPVLCATEVEALVAARQRLSARPGFDRVEVCFGDDCLFSVRRR